tara:strand:+ start:176 stop:400 length:225 start_codon:yes stop_codon:yes gene_type:complete
MTKSKRTQGELLEEISNKLTVIIDQLDNVLNYKPPVVDDNKEETIKVENYDYVQDKDGLVYHKEELRLRDESNI